jgi:hypothetical protein
MVMMFVGGVVCCLMDYSYYSYSRKSVKREFFVPAQTHCGKAVNANSMVDSVVAGTFFVDLSSPTKAGSGDRKRQENEIKIHTDDGQKALWHKH